MELFQASSGGEQWASRNHVNRDGRVPLAFRGYRLRAGARETEGLRATPVVVLSAPDAHVAVAVPHFWENFPRAIEGSTRTITVQLFPMQHGDLHELQPGEQKTHVFHVAAGRDEVADAPLDWVRSPLFARATPEHYCGSGAVPYLLPSDRDPHASYVHLVDAAIEGDASFEHKREAIDEYGWRNFGDMYADHELAYYTGPVPVISHYNNQYDAVAGLALQFMRTGDERWWRLMRDLAAHVVDIDLYHTTEDRSVFNRGLFWHTAHYTDAGRSTHRSYPRVPGVTGGGPANEHNYSTGLLLHHFLTGAAASRDAALDLARWVVDMDDGRLRPFGWLAPGDSGLASATHSPDYQGPGRGGAYSIAVLLNGFQAGGDRALLAKAETLVRRCIHPGDDIEARHLLHVEARWSYTVFLVTLGRYLDLKAELGEIDEAYAYARQALVAYARWMATHERPYLERPEELEFPTETWAAQELWKAEALAFGAKYGGEAERDALMARSRDFFEYACSTLERFPTRTRTRPLVLLLSRGLMNGYVRVHPEALSAPRGPQRTFGSPGLPFEPQKARVLRRLRVLAAVLALAGLAAVLALLRAV
ncbi:MAG: hypothetical protein FJW23_03895 [Acidimicrobiia bacterium]|nr:hypothetical protein [Acidimicrobiia bacterium]